MGCVRVVALTVAAAVIMLGVGLLGVTLYRAARGQSVLPALTYTQIITIFVFVPILLVATVLDYFKIDPLPGWCD